MRAARRALGLLVAAAAALALTGCAGQPAHQRLQALALEPDAGHFAPAVVHDDLGSESLLIVPPHPSRDLVVYVHGSGQSQYSVLDDHRDNMVARTLVAHGYLLLAALAGGRAWGDPASVADYERLIAQTVRAHRIDNVYLMAESMGGLATMQLAARVPQVRALTAWYPVVDLATMKGEPRFATAIALAWGDRSERPVSPVPVPRTPMMVWASPQDTVVSARLNAYAFVARARAEGVDATVIHTTGQHADISNFHPEAVLDFFRAHTLDAP